MAPRSTRSFRKGLPRKSLPRARLVTDANEQTILSCGSDPAALPYLTPKLIHKNLLIEGVRLYAANVLKQSMLSIGGDVAVHRNAITGRIETSDCLVMGDLRHYRLLVDKLRLQPGLGPLADIIEDQIFTPEEALFLRLCAKDFSWERKPVIMGILNITPDSFSDGGLWHDHERALDHALEMVLHGADILDIGGESSRPGAESIDADEEIRRVAPLIEKLAARTDIPISIDTKRARTAEAAIGAGARIINDISALSHDPDMPGIAAKTGAGVVLMHMRGTPTTMQSDTSYHDIVREIFSYLEERITFSMEKGIDPSSILIDPGIGLFGKDREGNLRLIHHIAQFKSLGMPVVLGHSRKAFIGQVLDTPVPGRQEGTDAVSAWAVTQGVDVLRVHDVLHTKRIRDMMNAIRENA